MSTLLHELPLACAAISGGSPALVRADAVLDYASLGAGIESFARALIAIRCQRHDRVAVYLPKQFEGVMAMFGAAGAGCVFVPVNPLLKAGQVEHILRDCNVRVLVTSADRLAAMPELPGHCPDLRHLIVVGDKAAESPKLPPHLSLTWWPDLIGAAPQASCHRVIDQDMAAIFYTSGSTGRPKGVVLSHRNMVTGAISVASYIENRPDDRLLAVLPFSFDYGFSQLSTAFCVGARVVLTEYLFPRDILTLLVRHEVTGLAGVPPLWSQLADLPWPSETLKSLRYITNSGGSMTGATLQKLRRIMPGSKIFLMYGLTEAFRSTYLPPAEIDRRPGSIGKAIPNAEIMVVRTDGSACDANEPGELVHRGALVSLGYWNDAEKTAERFRPAPAGPDGLMIPEMAVWSGDTVRRDEDGYLYFIGRRDEMIKTSGYRVSPTEIEEVVIGSGLVSDAVAIGVPHAVLGQAIVLVASPARGTQPIDGPVLDFCRRELPAYMMPMHLSWRESLPRNANGKYDRSGLASELQGLFAQAATE